MSSDPTTIQLRDPNNASNTLALEQLIMLNNRDIEEAFSQVLSRSREEGANYMCVTLDMNGNDIVNVGFSPFIRKSELASIQVGELQVNRITRDLEFRAANRDDFEILYTFQELQVDGGDAGAFSIGNPEETREDLGLTIGTDILAYDPVFDRNAPEFADPAGFLPIDDPRLDTFIPVEIIVSDNAVDTIQGSGQLYYASTRRGTPTASTFTLRVLNNELGSVNSIYAPAPPENLLIRLVPDDADIRLFASGSTTPLTSITIPQGSFASVVCVSPDGNDFVVSGPNLF